MYHKKCHPEKRIQERGSKKLGYKDIVEIKKKIKQGNASLLEQTSKNRNIYVVQHRNIFLFPVFDDNAGVVVTFLTQKMVEEHIKNPRNL